ncbi:hypothetical protein SERLA73DRAFT_143962 [Serpula lacrymans var. lacrymans S7.3]|uniref:Uncharacterized protein n=2 Tax=Serpula lacrymans var. lacrymans TaxID=341189 RepID=F8QAT4_SERL3|nr:uncharacterized protein SERLADRAFT_400964 [Serpula lacrymans var. lacrymans S7.9]EGN94320.1 hypothetical protein SERLA73DRAFT_143962 [Serpula lacrymans var. lacrymans S7.3]EGO19809.1 hypothetical protein SERLADRAFT_400964 [Serpula lacrymans var. lacrymans S7.9]
MTPTSSMTPSSEVIDLTDCDFTNYMFPSSSPSSLDSWPSSSSASTSQLDAFAWEKELLSFPSQSTGDFSQLFEQPQELFPCSPPKQVLPAVGAGAMDESDQLWCSGFPVSNSYSVDANFGSSSNVFATLPPLSSDGQWPTTWSLSNLDASFAPNSSTQSSLPLNWEDMMGIASSCGSPTETPSPMSSSPQSISDFNLGGSMDQFTIDSFLSGCFA